MLSVASWPVAVSWGSRSHTMTPPRLAEPILRVGQAGHQIMRAQKMAENLALISFAVTVDKLMKDPRIVVFKSIAQQVATNLAAKQQ